MNRIILLFIGLLTATVTFGQLQASFSTSVNTLCQGVDCDWDGPSILINEIQISPAGNIDGSLSGPAGTNQGKGEWIELYNPDLCNPVDISCYYLGNAAEGSNLFAGNVGGGFQLPQGTIVPPAGFCLVRGVNAAAVPANLLVENGGNVVEVVVPANTSDDGVCSDDAGFGFNQPRLWFPNAGGWFAFYDANGVPQDAISWGTEAGSNVAPCVAQNSGCNTGVTSLASYDNIPANRKNKIYNSGSPKNDNTIRRMPDGGDWAINQKTTPGTPGACNDAANCFEPGSSTCDGVATITVTGGSGNYSYQWNDSESQMTATATGLCEGTYEVVVTDNDSGVSQTFTVSIEDLVITYNSVITPSACGGDSGAITLNGTNGSSPYKYSLDNGPSQTNGTFDGLAAGSYSVTVVDDNGCVGTGNEVVTDEGDIDIDNVTTVNPTCPGDCDGEATVTVTTGTAPYTYKWLDSDGTELASTISQIDGLCEGSYSVTVTDASGCSATENFTITAPADQDASFTLTDYCEGDNNSATQIATSGGTFSIVSPTDDGATINVSTGSISNGVGGTTYTVEYSLPGGCASDTAEVTVFTMPSVGFGADPIVGEPPLIVTFDNNSTGADSYVWNLGDGNSSEEAGTFIHSYDEVGEYDVVLVGTTNNGCTDQATITIEVIYPEMEYEFPNVFSPNGDGQNDNWKLVYEINVSKIEIVILNRWGNVVFESDDLNFVWNGKVKGTGADCSEGVYFYKATLTNYSGDEVREHGYIHLNR